MSTAYINRALRLRYRGVNNLQQQIERAVSLNACEWLATECCISRTFLRSMCFDVIHGNARIPFLLFGAHVRFPGTLEFRKVVQVFFGICWILNGKRSDRHFRSRTGFSQIVAINRFSVAIFRPQRQLHVPLYYEWKQMHHFNRWYCLAFYLHMHSGAIYDLLICVAHWLLLT